MRPTNNLLSLFLIIILLYAIPQTGISQFREIYKDGNQINGISFISPSIGYVAFARTIGFTQDSGRTYSFRSVSYANTNFNGYSVGLTFGFTARGVKAFSSDSLFVYGDFSFEPSILFSSNGGQTWKLVYHLGISLGATSFSEGITDIEFPGNGAVGYAVHHEGVLKTFNKGQTWVPLLSASDQYLRKLSCPTPAVVFASGGAKLYKTTNGGTLWVNQPPPANNSYPDFNNVYFVSDLVGYCTDASSSQVYKTVNSGATWTKVNEPDVVSAGGNDLYFVNDSTGFLASYGVLKTTDSGKTWERCKNDKGGSYQINALAFVNDKTGWAGGGGLLLTTDGGATTWPKAYFKIDTANIVATGKVNLINYTKPGYNNSWFKNGQFLSSTYNASYTHSPAVVRDTIKLIVWNNESSDTLTKFIDFNPAILVYSFSPEVAYTGMGITIRGNDFTNVTSVSFGGVPARFFQIRSLTEIYAEVGNGASGDVRITNSSTSGSKSGFVYLSAPRTDLTASVQDTMLCKEEPAIVSIPNSEPDVRYELWDANKYNALGAAKGNGGELRFTSLPISQTGTYYIWATRTYLSTSITRMLPKGVRVVVEHTHSVLYANKINAELNEPVNYFNYSVEAATFSWIFADDASTTRSSSPAPVGITYSTGGQKKVTLMSTSSYGCSDTVTTNAVFVYSNPVGDDVCYANNIADDDAYESYGQLLDMKKDVGEGYLICGFGNNPLLKSRYGTSKKIVGNSIAHLSKYNKDGTLRWMDYCNSGQIKAVVTDKDGNIYITGYSYTAGWFHFNNGDSMNFVPSNAYSNPAFNKVGGYVMKLDAAGKYIWHTLIFDPSLKDQGYTVLGGIPARIFLQNDQLVIIGSCLANLSYYNNGTVSPIMSYRNSVYQNDNQNNFILNINTDGNYNWSAYSHNEATNQIRAFSDVVMDASGNTYVTGYYERSVELYDAFTNSLTFEGSTGGSLGYLLKYDRQGHLLWNMRMTNMGNTPRALAIEPSGMLYMTGNISCADPSQYALINNTDGTTTQASYGGYFLMKVSPAGKTIWTQGTRYVNGGGAAVYCDGESVYTTGLANRGRENTAPIPFTSQDSSLSNLPINESAFFLTKYDTSGRLLKLNSSGVNIGGHISPTCLFTDSKKNILLGGNTDPYNGGNGQHLVFGSIVYPSGQDAFYARLNPDFCNVIPTFYPRAGNDTTICSGSQITLGLSNPNGYTYAWSASDGSATSTAPTATVRPVANTTYYVSLLNPSGIITRDTITINVMSVPVANAGTDKFICPGGPVAIGTTATGDTYQWTSQPAGFAGIEATPVVKPAVNTRYFLAVKNVAGCIAYDTVMINVNNPVANAGPDKENCLGGSVVIGGSDAGDEYQWTAQPAGFFSSVANPVVTPLVNTRYFLIVKNVMGCMSYDTVDVNIAIAAIANAGLDKEVCPGSSTTIGTAATAGNNYKWTSQPTGFTSSTANPTVSPLVNTRYFLILTNSAGCVAYDTVNVNVVTPPLVNAGPDRNICPGTITTIGLAVTGDTYQWTSLPAGFISPVANPAVSPLVNTRYFLITKNAKGCVAYDTVNVNLLPGLTINAGPDKEICLGSSTGIGPGSTANLWQWTSQPAGFSSTLTYVVVTPLVSTRYFLVVRNIAGCAAYDTVNVNVVTAPPANAGPDINLCLGGSSTIGVASTTGNTYQWTSQPAGFTSSAADPAVKPSVNTRYFLMVKNTTGCAAYDTVNVNVKTASLANAGSDKSLCLGNSVTIGTNGTPGNAYQWTSQPASFTSSVADPVVSPLVNTRYFLAMSSGVGCIANDTVDIFVKALPSKPIVFKNAGDSLTSSSPVGNQWYIDTITLITSAINQRYKPAADGLYSVRITQDGCTSPFSAKFDYKLPVITAIGDPDQDTTLAAIFPNPAHDRVRITFQIWGVRQLHATVLDARGRELVTHRNISSGNEFSVVHLSPGFYIIKLYDDKNKVQFARQLVKY